MAAIKDSIDYCVYVLSDPRTDGDYQFGDVYRGPDKPFYVGMGSFNRPYEHLAEARRSTRKTHKLNKIRRILKTHESYGVTLIGAPLTRKQAISLEIRAIAVIGRHDLGEGPLTNKTNGGEGASGAKRTKKQRSNHGKAFRKFLQSMTDAERQDYYGNIVELTRRTKAETKMNMSELERKEQHDRISKIHADRWDRKTLKEQLDFAEKASKRMRSWSPEKIALKVSRAKSTMEAKSEAEKMALAGKKSAASKRMHQVRPEIVKAEIYGKVSESIQDFYEGLTPSQRKKHAVNSIRAKQESIRRIHRGYLNALFSTLRFSPTTYRTFEEMRDLVPSIPKCTLTRLLKDYSRSEVLRTQQFGANQPKQYMFVL